MSFPKLIKVKRLIKSRYQNFDNCEEDQNRPASWNHRKPGIDLIESDSGEELQLLSSGGQPAPKEFWDIVLTSGDKESGYQWTLYGLGQKNGE